MAILYKYFPLASCEQLERVLRIFEGKIYFSSPASFNDPFEMSPVSCMPNKDDFHEVMQRVSHEYNYLTKSAKHKLYNNVSNSLSCLKPKATTDAWLQTLGVLCLTPNPRNLLMWAHYGSNHTGVCIGFDGQKQPFVSAQPIEYSRNRPKVSIKNNGVKSCIATNIELFFASLELRSLQWRGH